jgi:hypothetical protein
MTHSLNNDQRNSAVASPLSRTSINNVRLLHLLPRLGSLIFIDRVGLVPMFVRNDAKLELGVGHRADAPEKNVNQIERDGWE